MCYILRLLKGDIGVIKHVTCYFGVNLAWLFEDPRNTGSSFLLFVTLYN
jgi:hypothetical protein